MTDSSLHVPPSPLLLLLPWHASGGSSLYLRSSEVIKLVISNVTRRPGSAGIVNAGRNQPRSVKSTGSALAGPVVTAPSGPSVSKNGLDFRLFASFRTLLLRTASARILLLFHWVIFRGTQQPCFRIGLDWINFIAPLKGILICHHGQQKT